MYLFACVEEGAKKSSSYQNLLPHVRTAHANYLQTLSVESNLSQTHLDEFFSTSKANNLYGWTDFIVNGLRHFHYVEKSFNHKHIKHQQICYETLMKYLFAWTEHV